VAGPEFAMLRRERASLVAYRFCNPTRAEMASARAFGFTANWLLITENYFAFWILAAFAFAMESR